MNTCKCPQRVINADERGGSLGAGFVEDDGGAINRSQVK